MATYGNGIKVSAAATSGGAVPANSFAVVTYTATAYSSTAINTVTSPMTRIYGPGATVLATFTTFGQNNTGVSMTCTWTFASGVILTNS